MIKNKGGIILELLFDQKLWNDEELNRKVLFKSFSIAVGGDYHVV